MVVMKDNDFIENYAGLKGSAIFIKQVSRITIDNGFFIGNGPVYSRIE
jgi:predicted outer membrane repeat protein